LNSYSPTIYLWLSSEADIDADELKELVEQIDEFL